MKFLYYALLFAPAVLAATQDTQAKHDVQAEQHTQADQNIQVDQNTQADQHAEAMQDVEAMQADVIDKADNLIDAVSKTCTDLPQQCVGSMVKLLQGVQTGIKGQSVTTLQNAVQGFVQDLTKSQSCVSQLTTCVNKVGPKINSKFAQ